MNDMAPETPSPSTTPRTSRAIKFALVACMALLALLIAGGLALQIVAYRAYSRSFSPSLPLAERVAAAAQAHRLEPWDTRFSVRSTVMAWWVSGKQMLDRGDWNGAVAVLAQAYKLDVGDAELLALFKQAQRTQALETNRKAHLQHGHEGPGGTLRPQDIER